jgi:hypothetical protein
VGRLLVGRELLVVDGVLVQLGRPVARAHARALLYEGEARVPRYYDDLYWVSGRL